MNEKSSPHAGATADNGDKGLDEHNAPPYMDNEHAIQHVSADQLARKLSARQVSMIAIGGTIGTGLFLGEHHNLNFLGSRCTDVPEGTGKSLATGGPASMVLSYAIVGVIVFNTMLALGEMAAFMPIAGVRPCFSLAAGTVLTRHDSHSVHSLDDSSMMPSDSL